MQVSSVHCNKDVARLWTPASCAVTGSMTGSRHAACLNQRKSQLAHLPSQVQQPWAKSEAWPQPLQQNWWHRSTTCKKKGDAPKHWGMQCFAGKFITRQMYRNGSPAKKASSLQKASMHTPRMQSWPSSAFHCRQKKHFEKKGQRKISWGCWLNVSSWRHRVRAGAPLQVLMFAGHVHTLCLPWAGCTPVFPQR